MRFYYTYHYHHTITTTTATTAIRIGVEMSVAELFHVNDKISGALLQGEENTVKLNKHELLLETTYNISTMELGDWCIVDIDNWMSGNNFWFDQSDLIKKNEED